MQRTIVHIVALPLVAVALAACQTNHANHARSAAPSSTAHDEQMLGRIAALEGDWEMADEEGQPVLASTFSVTAAHSAVREIMFPGDDHEMTNLYHMDGPDLVITHYCAAGNQPRMVASEAHQTEEGAVYYFDFESVSNLRDEHTHYMGNMTLIILNDGTIREEWRAYDRQGELTEPTTFVMQRKVTW